MNYVIDWHTFLLSFLRSLFVWVRCGDRCGRVIFRLLLLLHRDAPRYPPTRIFDWPSLIFDWHNLILDWPLPFIPLQYPQALRMLPLLIFTINSPCTLMTNWLNACYLMHAPRHSGCHRRSARGSMVLCHGRWLTLLSFPRHIMAVTSSLAT